VGVYETPTDSTGANQQRSHKMKNLIQGNAVIPLLPIPEGECLKRTERLHIGDRFNVPGFAGQFALSIQSKLGLAQKDIVYLIFLQGVLSIQQRIESNNRIQPNMEAKS
jgi:hypothetical protein